MRLAGRFAALAAVLAAAPLRAADDAPTVVTKGVVTVQAALEPAARPFSRRRNGDDTDSVLL